MHYFCKNIWWLQNKFVIVANNKGNIPSYRQASSHTAKVTEMLLLFFV